MANIGKRKDGRYYPKGSVGDPAKGISKDMFDKLKRQDARRSPNARAIDISIKAPIDLDGRHWKLAPNRYDVRDIDDPATTKRKKGIDIGGGIMLHPDDDFELVT
jgi:hypothetical protein